MGGYVAVGDDVVGEGEGVGMNVERKECLVVGKGVKWVGLWPKMVQKWVGL